MSKFDIDIQDRSVWVTATPINTSVSMPFCITEIGHFYAGENYVTERTGHDSYMLIYSSKGGGYLKTGDFGGEIDEGSAVVFDCHTPHYYSSCGKKWDFYWIHINGAGVEGIVNAVNYNGIRTVNIKKSAEFTARIKNIIDIAENNDICTLADISAKVHTLLNTILRDSLNTESYSGGHTSEVQRTVRYIEENYTEPINIDDIINQVHISKYYFIRLFKQYMGMTPYSYLINYRINQSKILLRTQNISVGEISRETGFCDVSNFINQFKKQTGQRPMDYRRSFSN